MIVSELSKELVMNPGTLKKHLEELLKLERFMDALEFAEALRFMIYPKFDSLGGHFQILAPQTRADF